MNEHDPLLIIRDVSKVYVDKKGRHVKKALNTVSFELREGEIFALLGVNGAGKTTLSSILATMHPLTSGDILWKKRSIYEQLLDYRTIIGMCPQKPNIEKRLTIEENLLFSGYCYSNNRDKVIGRKNALMKQFNLETYAKANADQLSGGYKQRFLIARALMHEPKLLILDEPTVGLDPHIRRQLWDVIRGLKSDKVTVILTTHYLDEAEYLSDRVCLIHDGVIKTVDTPENLKKQHQKNNLEEVFLKFVDDPEAQIFNSVSIEHE